nr:HEAT repeat domain-containing protein [Tessaracoccus sp. MC1756]
MNAIASLRDGDERARQSLAHLLGKLRDPAGIATLGQLALDDSEAVAAKAAFGLGQVGGEAAAGLLVPLLTDERGAVREEATRSLGRIPEAGWLLRDAAADASAVMRLHAMEALAGHRDPADVPVLIAGLHDADPEARLAALLALGERPEPEATDAMAEQASSTDDRTRLVARRLLGLP